MALRTFLASGSAAALLALSAGGASAASFYPVSGNGGNVCGGSIEGCSIMVDGVSTPAIAKFNVADFGDIERDDEGVNGPVGAFMISLIDQYSADFTYTVQEGDLGLNAIFVKGGSNGGTLFTYSEGDFEYNADTMTFSGTFSTEGLLNNGRQQPAISNVVFFDSFTFPGGGGGENPPPVPLPAAGFMLLAGLGGLAAAKRRKN